MAREIDIIHQGQFPKPVSGATRVTGIVSNIFEYEQVLSVVNHSSADIELAVGVKPPFVAGLALGVC
jgi:hypothetical protein